MTVAVQQGPAKKDPLDTLQQALKIASNIYGVALDKQKTNAAIEQNRLKQQSLQNEQTRKADGELNQGDIDSFVRSGGEIAPLGTASAPPGFGRVGQQKGAPIFGRKIPAAPAPGTEFNQLHTLRQEYGAKSKETNELINAYSRMEPHVKEKNPTGTSDMALIYQFNKILDPGSTVREGEFANAQSAASFDDRIRVYRDQLLSGKKLSDTQRKDIIHTSQQMVSGQLENQRQIDAEFAGLAHGSGLDKKQILDSRYEKMSAKLQKSMADFEKQNVQTINTIGSEQIGSDPASEARQKRILELRQKLGK